MDSFKEDFRSLKLGQQGIYNEMINIKKILGGDGMAGKTGLIQTPQYQQYLL